MIMRLIETVQRSPCDDHNLELQKALAGIMYWLSMEGKILFQFLTYL